MTEPKQRAPYCGIRILDLSRVLAGPYATLVLADLGAEVIKIENHRGGDDSRQFKPPDLGGTSTYFLTVNRNKKSLAIDLKDARGRETFLRLAANSDVVVENFRSGVVERLGVDYEAVKRVREDIVYCSISGYGRTGSHARVPGYDPVAQAESGLMSMNGLAEGPPVRTGTSQVDMVTGLYAAQAISGALWHRERTGEGQHLEVCLFDTALNMLLNYAGSELMVHDEPVRTGNGSPVAQPSGTYTCRDGDLMLTVGSDRVFTTLCEVVLRRPDLAADERFETNPGRIRNKGALDALLEEAFAREDRAVWLARLRDAGVPSGPVNSVTEALGQALVEERGLVVEMTHDRLGKVPGLRSPMRLAASPTVPLQAAPDLGEHTSSVLTEVGGLAVEEVAALAVSGVIGGVVTD